MDFKKEDRVWYVGENTIDSRYPKKGSDYECQGTVSDEGECAYTVKWDNGTFNHHPHQSHSTGKLVLELVTAKLEVGSLVRITKACGHSAMHGKEYRIDGLSSSGKPLIAGTASFQGVRLQPKDFVLLESAPFACKFNADEFVRIDYGTTHTLLRDTIQKVLAVGVKTLTVRGGLRVCQKCCKPLQAGFEIGNRILYRGEAYGTVRKILPKQRNCVSIKWDRGGISAEHPRDIKIIPETSNIKEETKEDVIMATREERIKHQEEQVESQKKDLKANKEALERAEATLKALKEFDTDEAELEHRLNAFFTAKPAGKAKAAMALANTLGRDVADILMGKLD